MAKDNFDARVVRKIRSNPGIKFQQLQEALGMDRNRDDRKLDASLQRQRRAGAIRFRNGWRVA